MWRGSFEKGTSARVVGPGWRVALTACALLTGSAAVPLTLRGDCIEYDGYLRLRGGLSLPAANEVKIAGSYAYVIADKTLHVVDITNPVAPQDVGQVVVAPSAPWINGMAVQSPYVFVTAPDRFGSLWILDVSNPHAPRIVGAFFAGFPVGEVVTSGAYVYVTTPTGIGIVDVSNLSAPTFVNTVNIPRGAGALAVAGNHVYVVGQLGLTIVDVSTPLNASIIGQVELPGGINGSITLAGEYAYVGDSLSPSGTGDDLQIVDISDPSAPAVVNAIPQKSVEAVVVGDHLYRISPIGLLAFDVTDPTSPTITGSLPAAGGYGLASSGDFIFVADYSRGLLVVDVSNPFSAVPLGTVELPGAPNIYLSSGGIVLSNGLAQSVAGAFAVIDIVNPESPTVLGEITGDFGFVDVATNGQFTYAVTWDSLHVIDVTDPASPAIVGSTATGGRSIAISGDYAYLANGTGELEIFSLSDPRAPTWAGLVDMPGECSDIAIMGQHAFIASNDAGLQILDLSTPSSPSIVGHFDAYVSAVAVAGHFAYSGGATFHILDVADPSMPLLVGSTTLPVNCRSIAVAGHHAYVAGAYTGLQIVDVSNPAAPRLAGNSMAPNVLEYREAVGVAVADDFVYLTDGALFSVIPTQCTTPLPVTLTSFEALPENDAITVVWITGQAVDHAGFNIERSTGAGDPYRRLNAQLITPARVQRYLDTDVKTGSTYSYRLEAVDRNGASTFFGPISATLGETRLQNHLRQSRPNPFRTGSTVIAFDLSQRTRAELTIYDVSGRRVRELLHQTLGAGHHVASWDGRDDRGIRAAPGIYFYRLATPSFTDSRRLVLMR